MLVAHCALTGAAGDHALMLTRRRLVVTAKTRLTRRLRLHLHFELHQLADVTWTPEPGLGGAALAVTAIDVVREHFWIETADAAAVDRILTEVFRAALPVLAA
jgi:hypothetical protein